MNYDDLEDKLHNLLELSSFICKDISKYSENSKIIKKMISHIEKGKIDKILKERGDEDV